MQNEPNTSMSDMGSGVADEVSRLEVPSTHVWVDSLQSGLGQLIEFAPKFLAAIVVLAIGFLIAKLIARGVAALSEKLGIQRAAERGGIAESMRQANVTKTVPQLLGAIVFWLLMTFFLVAACDILELQAVGRAAERVLAYIPNVIAASLLLVIGLMLASFARGVIATSVERFEMPHAQPIAAGCYYVLVLMVTIAAFEQLQIEFELLNSVFLIAFAAVALALGLSFGLGGR